MKCGLCLRECNGRYRVKLWVGSVVSIDAIICDRCLDAIDRVRFDGLVEARRTGQL
jgi:hypothetical protein